MPLLYMLMVGSSTNGTRKGTWRGIGGMEKGGNQEAKAAV
jgi:hypothetical protein